MRFKLFLLGGILLAIGLIAYTAIPNVHQTQISESQPLSAQDPITVPALGDSEVSSNLTLYQGKQNQLQTNVTVTAKPGQARTILFQLYPKNQTSSCLAQPKTYLVNQEITNQSLLQTPVTTSGNYCFVFRNENSPITKTVLLAATINTSFVQVQVTNDGGMNLAGLGVSAFGFLVAIFGASRKTVIPWE